jgi:hypothetical protein
MRIYRGLELPTRTGNRARYDFAALQHGDAFEAQSVPSALESYRRWKKKSGSRGRLVRSTDPNQRNLLFFIEGAGPKVPVCDEV